MGLESLESWGTAALAIDRPPLALAGDDRIAMTRLRETLESALRGREDIVRRLGHADTAVTFRVGQRDEATLLCEASRVQVAAGHDLGEIVLELSEEQARRFCAAELCIPTAVATGSIHFEGPVRRFLTVASVLRTLIAATRTDDRPAS